jgi:hypothetical protein
MCDCMYVYVCVYEPSVCCYRAGRRVLVIVPCHLHESVWMRSHAAAMLILLIKGGYQDR